MRLAVYGGSFDPPHRAHVLAAQYVLTAGLADRVLVVPVFQHAFGKRMEAFEHRYRMCERAFGGLAGIRVSRIEAELSSPSYTAHTLEAVRAKYPDADLRFVVGADALRDSHQWHRFDEVCRLAPLIVLGREGARMPEEPAPVLPNISSTDIRSWLAARTCQEMEERLRRSVPTAVLEYIDEHGLYVSQARDETSPTPR